jgi:hypothetical protein
MAELVEEEKRICCWGTVVNEQEEEEEEEEEEVFGIQLQQVMDVSAAKMRGATVEVVTTTAPGRKRDATFMRSNDRRTSLDIMLDRIVVSES